MLQTLSENTGRENTHLEGINYLDTKTRQRNYKKM